MRKNPFLPLLTIMILSLSLSFISCKKDMSDDTKVTEESDEIEALADKDTIRLTTLDWEPYIGESLTDKGYVYEIIVEAYKKVGKKVDIKFYPWARTVRLSELGKVDGHFPEYYDEGRLKGWLYSKDYPGGPVGFYKRKESNIKFTANPQTNQISALRGMKNYKFGIVRDYINTKDFDLAAGLNIPADMPEAEKKKIIDNKFLQTDEARDDAENLKKLFGKRVDLIFIDKYVARYIIIKQLPHYMDELTFMEPPLQNNPLYVCISKNAPDYQEKLDLFNKGLAIIKNDGTLKRIMAKHGF